MAHQYATVTDTHMGLEHTDTAQLEGARKKKKKKHSYKSCYLFRGKQRLTTDLEHLRKCGRVMVDSPVKKVTPKTV